MELLSDNPELISQINATENFVVRGILIKREKGKGAGKLYPDSCAL